MDVQRASQFATQKVLRTEKCGFPLEDHQSLGLHSPIKFDAAPEYKSQYDCEYDFCVLAKGKRGERDMWFSTEDNLLIVSMLTSTHQQADVVKGNTPWQTDFAAWRNMMHCSSRLIL